MLGEAYPPQVAHAVGLQEGRGARTGNTNARKGSHGLDSQFGIRMTPAEREGVRKAAQLRGMRCSEFARLVLVEASQRSLRPANHSGP
jgi:hypothetical protein